MTGLQWLTVFAAGGGLMAVLVAASVLWAVGDKAPVPIGSWDPPPPPATHQALPPGELRWLWRGESTGWGTKGTEWSTLVARLDALEMALGGEPRSGPAPLEHSPDWLAARLAELERLAGPVPGVDSVPYHQEHRSR